MIIVTHEMSFASDAANRVIFMAGGVVVEEGKPDEIISRCGLRIWTFLWQSLF